MKANAITFRTFKILLLYEVNVVIYHFRDIYKQMILQFKQIEILGMYKAIILFFTKELHVFKFLKLEI